MSTNKHTPGPLPLRITHSMDAEGKLIIVTAQGSHYATTYDPSAARLIAAAPELLDALREMLPGYQCRNDRHAAIKACARAAIAKATGNN